MPGPAIDRRVPGHQVHSGWSPSTRSSAWPGSGWPTGQRPRGRRADADRLLAQAAEALGESVRLKSDYAPGYLYRAKALLRLGRLPEAEEAARAGVGCRPEQWEGYLVLADVLAATGRKADGVTAAEQAVKLAHPNDPRPKQALEALKKVTR
jgi:tetratricopeptide (TPR) repeat protein